MNSNFLSINWKHVGVSLLAAVVVAAWNLIGPALQAAMSTGVFIINWAILGYYCLNAFLSTLMALFFTNSNGQPLVTENGKILGIINIKK